MKALSYQFLFLLISFAVAISCSSSKNTTKSDQTDKPEVVDTGYGLALDKNLVDSNNSIKPNERAPSNLSLADMLRKVSGVTVTGNGNNVKIIVRGVSSFGANDPLYVLNGVSVGNNYAMVANTINTNEITSIRVLKGAEAAIYGTQGGNGVILIRTKTTR